MDYNNIPFNHLDLNLGGGSLLQICNRDFVQMMSYLVETPDGHLVMIDGGFNFYGHHEHVYEADGQYLYSLLKSKGKKIDHWIFTHPHDDHYGAFLWMISNVPNFDIEIGEFWYNWPPKSWYETTCREKPNDFDKLEMIDSWIDQKGLVKHHIKQGDVINIGGMSFEFLLDCDDLDNIHYVNDLSCVFMAHFPTRDVLFLGDLAVEGEKRLLAAQPLEKIKCDVVQLGHHGQCGPTKEFYEKIQPKVCLYCAPDWLWDNYQDISKGKNSGPFKTIETRQWMQEIGAVVSCPCAFGDFLFT